MWYDDEQNISELPSQQYFYPYVLVALHRLGGRAEKKEVVQEIQKRLNPSDVVLEEKTDTGAPKFSNWIAFARLWLQLADYIAPTEKRGVWELSDEGRGKIKQLEESSKSERQEFCVEVDTSAKENLKEKRKNAAASAKPGEQQTQDASVDVIEHDEEIDIDNMQERMKRKHLRYIQTEIDPYAFERLCSQLLRAVGYEDVVTTRGSGDGGIDGFGYFSTGLTRTRVIFQAKRFGSSGSIGPNLIRELGGAKAAHPEVQKALFISSATFSKEAKILAQKLDIELIDGDRLIDLLYKHELGYSKSEIHTLNEKFFTEELIDHSGQPESNRRK